MDSPQESPEAPSPAWAKLQKATGDPHAEEVDAGLSKAPWPKAGWFESESSPSPMVYLKGQKLKRSLSTSATKLLSLLMKPGFSSPLGKFPPTNPNAPTPLWLLSTWSVLPSPKKVVYSLVH